jgi:chaperonin GroES
MQGRIWPLGDRVVIKEIETQDKIGSIYVPDSAKQKPTIGEVIAVGSGIFDHFGKKEEVICRPMSCAVGDKVIYGKYSGVEVEVAGDTLLVIKESDILGVYYDE